MKAVKFLFFVVQSLMVFVACADFFSIRKELDIEILTHPPKLSVNAIFNGETGTLIIRVMEGISLADYNLKYRNKEIIRDGEIHLYENDEIILSISGPFDMSSHITQFWDRGKWGQNGYYYVSPGINTNPGCNYRLEVDVEGYPPAVATSTMPEKPVTWASMDTSVSFIKKNVKEIGVAGYWLDNLGSNWNNNYPDSYWPLSVNIEDPGVDNYYALDIINIENNDNDISRITFWGIGGSDVSILLENGMNRELLNNDNTDLYLFNSLITKASKGESRKFYVAIDSSMYYPVNNDLYLIDNPDFEKITTIHQLMLRVRKITPETYRYFHSLSLQYTNNMYNEQPASVIGNFEGGFGIFSVFSATYITLLEWETFEYRIK